jgi:outer membrane protein assembly factor BamB
MPVVMALLTLLPPAMVEGGGADSGTVAVMFYYGPEEYYWSSATADGSADAVAVSKMAADNMNRAFVYDDATGAVEIGGLRPGANDTWKWSLLSWDTINERWAPWAGGPHGLKPLPGGALAWSPNTTANPTPNPLSRYPWPMDRCGAARRGETLSPAPMTNLSYWTSPLGMAVRSAPCVAQGRVFILADGTLREPDVLFCLDELTGRTVWKTELGAAEGSGTEYGAPAFHDGMVLVGTSDGKVRSLHARNGTVEWTFPAASPPFGTVSSIVVDGGRVLFTTGEGAVHCLGMDGRAVWKTNVSAPFALHPAAPAVLGDRLVVGTQEGRLLCLELGNGSIVWNVSLSGHTVTAPALSSEGYAFVLSSAGPAGGPGNMTLHSFFIRDAVQQWSANYPQSLSSPAVSAGGLFLGTGDEIVGHHPDRGTKFWGVGAGRVDASPAVARGFVYYAASAPAGSVGCVRVGGFVEWTLSAGAPISASPVVADGRLFVATVNGTVLCLGRPPAARVNAGLSAPAKASEGDTVRVRASLNNTGEAPALFTVTLTTDGNRTDLKKGPFTLQPGEKLNVSFEWRAVKGNHTLGLFYNGTSGTFTPAHVEVAKSAEACSSVIWTTALAAVALVVPSVVKWDRRRKR